MPSKKKAVHDIFLQDAQEHNRRLAQRSEVDDKVKAVLTAEQSKQYESLKESRKQAMQNRLSNKRGNLKAAPAPAQAPASK